MTQQLNSIISICATDVQRKVDSNKSGAKAVYHLFTVGEFEIAVGRAYYHDIPCNGFVTLMYRGNVVAKGEKKVLQYLKKYQA